MKQTTSDEYCSLSRRDGLRSLLGCAALTWGMPARLAFAAPTESGRDTQRRLVVVMLRGALDGLAVVPAIGDPAWSELRGQQDAASRSQALAYASAAGNTAGIAALQAPLLPLDTTFALHPALTNLHQWYLKQELLVVHAVASPYRERSHFDAQQLLESGGDRPFAQNSGWIGRAMQISGQHAVALTAAMPLALRGADTSSTWTPAVKATNHHELMLRVAQMYSADIPLSNALSQAMGQEDMARQDTLQRGGEGSGLVGLAHQAGKFLSDPKGPRVAWLEAGGWDTHTQQAGRLGRLLPVLDEALAALQNSLGQNWAHTSVLVMTEFGRSATLNGSGGTDHGTAGVAFVAGGEVAGGRVMTDWPGLAKGQLLDGRDLKPTLDIRQVIGPMVQRQFAISTSELGRILPGGSMAQLNLFRS